jgi:hypothetical protein
LQGLERADSFVAFVALVLAGANASYFIAYARRPLARPRRVAAFVLVAFNAAIATDSLAAIAAVFAPPLVGAGAGLAGRVALLGAVSFLSLAIARSRR